MGKSTRVRGIRAQQRASETGIEPARSARSSRKESVRLQPHRSSVRTSAGSSGRFGPREKKSNRSKVLIIGGVTVGALLLLAVFVIPQKPKEGPDQAAAPSKEEMAKETTAEATLPAAVDTKKETATETEQSEPSEEKSEPAATPAWAAPDKPAQSEAASKTDSFDEKFKPAVVEEKTEEEEKKEEGFDPTQLFKLDRTPSQKAVTEDDPEEGTSGKTSGRGKKKTIEDGDVAGLLDEDKPEPPRQPARPSKPSPRKKNNKKNKSKNKATNKNPKGSKPQVHAAPAPGPRAQVPANVLKEWQGKLVQRIDSAAKKGKPLKGSVRIDGNLKTYPLLSADDAVLQVEINGNPMPVPWNWLKPRDRAELVRSLATRDDLESQLMLAVFFLASNQERFSRAALHEAALIDEAAATKLRKALSL